MPFFLHYFCFSKINNHQARYYRMLYYAMLDVPRALTCHMNFTVKVYYIESCLEDTGHRNNS